MKLEVIEKYSLEGLKNWMRQAAFTTNGLAAFLFEKKYPLQSLVFIREEKVSYREIEPQKNSRLHGNDIVVFACQDKICILRNIYELEVITNPEQPSFILPVKNGNFLKKIIPDTDHYKPAELRSLAIVSDGPVFPVGFEYNGYSHDIRNIGYLELDIIKGVARWIDFTGITEEELFPDRRHDCRGKDLIKYDSAMMQGDEVCFFCPGAKTTSANKWGMDWYALLKIDRKGKRKEKIMDSGLLEEIDQKKRGVHGVFSYSRQYAILTPHFDSDEWKGKQKLFELSTREYIDIQMPRGLAKGRIVQHTGNHFWVSSHNEDNLYLAVCREVK